MKQRLVMVVMVLSLSVAALAAPPTSPKVKKQDLILFHDSEVAGTWLKAGDYQIAVTDGTATFYHNGKVAATFAVRDQEVPAKFQQSSVVYDAGGHNLLEIRLAGSDAKLLVEGTVSGAASGK
jgi:hypothetical protein